MRTRLKQVGILVGLLTFACVLMNVDAGAQTHTIPRVVQLPLKSENLILYKFLAARFYTNKKETIPGDLFFKPFTPLDSIFAKDSLYFHDSVQCAWFRFTLQNTGSQPEVLALIFPIGVNKAILYRADNKRLVFLGKTGFTLAVGARTISYEDNRVDLQVPPGVQTDFYIQVPRLGFIVMLVKSPVLEKQSSADIRAFKLQYNINRPGLLWSHFFSGVFFMFFVFGIIKFLVLGRDTAYLYYALLGLSNTALTIVQSEYPAFELPWFENLRGIELFNLVNGIAIFMQGLFILKVLELKRSHPVIYLGTVGFLFLQLLIAGLYTSSWIFDKQYLPFFIAIYPYHQFLFLLMIGSWVIYLYTLKKRFYRFIFFGALTIFIAFSLYFVVQTFELFRMLPAWLGGDKRGSVNHFMQIALVIDLVFYFTGLAYRDREVESDKERFQKQFISQLEANNELREKFTAGLEKQVKEKTDELVAQRLALENEKQAKLIADFNRKFSESELKALRSQMNPHFVFNILNTIESYALENNKEAASKMIQKFSRLTRLVLENSMNQLVPFENDWMALRLYIELEQMRYADIFEVSYQVDPVLIDNGYLIPPMILQPFVENAIIHGLRNRPGKGGILLLSARLHLDAIVVHVEDNGIGRKKSSLLKADNPINRISLGIKVTQDRISIYNNINQDQNARVEFLDLEVGTRVIITLPIHKQPATDEQSV